VNNVEIRPASRVDQAWTVTEIDRRWPTQVDAVAVDPHSLKVLDSTLFGDFPLMAKLTRWGVDFHMGILFGLANHLLLIRVWRCAVCVNYLGIPDVVDASPCNVSRESGTDALPKLAGIAAVGKGNDVPDKPPAGAGVAGNGRQSGGLYCD
jgi:hypothetical protein